MKKLTHTLLAVGSIFVAAVSSHAQTPKIVVVDVEKVFNQHYETEAEKAKLESQRAAAQKDMETLAKDRNTLIEAYKALEEQGKNPAMTADSKSKAQADQQAKLQEINAKQQEMQTFANNARGTLQQQFGTFRAQLMDSITKIALRIGKGHGATLILNSGAHFQEGTTSVLFADSSMDITDEVMAEINRNKPAGSAAAPSSASSSAPASSSESPSFSVPNLTPGK